MAEKSLNNEGSEGSDTSSPQPGWEQEEQANQEAAQADTGEQAGRIVAQEFIEQTQQEVEVADFEENFAAQQEYAQELALEQEGIQIKEQIAVTVQEGRKYKHPSYIKYYILFQIAGIVDIVDFLDWTAIGTVVARIVAIGGGILIIMICWFTNTKYHKAKKYQEKVAKLIETSQRNIARTVRTTYRLGRLARRFKFTRKIGTKTLKGLAKARKLTRGNPLLKVAVGCVINIIPWLSAVPWTVVGVLLSYWDEREVLRNAHQAAEDLEPYGESI